MSTLEVINFIRGKFVEIGGDHAVVISIRDNFITPNHIQTHSEQSLTDPPISLPPGIASTLVQQYPPVAAPPVAPHLQDMSKYMIKSDILSSFWNELRNAQDDGNFLRLSSGTFPYSPYREIFIRQCYKDYISLLKHYNQITLFKGNPGIGKSIFGYYLLYIFKQIYDKVEVQAQEEVQQQEEEIPKYKHILYDRVNKSPVLFSHNDNGEAVAYTLLDRNSIALVLECIGTDVVYIVDGQRPRESTNQRVIIISSPKKDVYEQYMKDGGKDTETYIFPLWKEEELGEANKLVQYGYTENEWRHRYNRWGPIPRYVLEKIKKPDQEELIAALSNTTLEAVFNSINQPDLPQTGSHKVIHIDIKDPKDYQTTIIKFGSEFIKEKLVQRFYWNWREELLSKVEKSSSMALNGIVFEQLSHQTFRSGGHFNVRPLAGGPTTRMEFAPDSLVYFANAQELKNRKNTLKFIPDSVYARPTDRNHAAIDSFLGSNLFQMTISRSHPIPLKELNNMLFDLNPDMSNSSRQYNLFFVVPKDKFNNFPKQKYINVESIKNVDGTTTTKREQVTEDREPQNVTQYALEMVFTSVPAKELYPCLDDEDKEIIGTGVNIDIEKKN